MKWNPFISSTQVLGCHSALPFFPDEGNMPIELQACGKCCVQCVCVCVLGVFGVLPFYLHNAFFSGRENLHHFKRGSLSFGCNSATAIADASGICRVPAAVSAFGVQCFVCMFLLAANLNKKRSTEQPAPAEWLISPFEKVEHTNCRSKRTHRRPHAKLYLLYFCMLYYLTR